MTNVVTIETAKRLKEAGFPNRHGRDVFFYDRFGLLFPLFWLLQTRGAISTDDAFFFAPTAEGILSELPAAVACKVASGWLVKCHDGDAAFGATHERLSDAAAQAWLQLQLSNQGNDDTRFA